MAILKLFEDGPDYVIGTGSIGSKANGLVAARKILQEIGEKHPIIAKYVNVPRSFFVAADNHQEFLNRNNLNDIQAPPFEKRADLESFYADMLARYAQAEFSSALQDSLQEVLDLLGNAPLVVRSSSRLEDSIETAMAGKYSTVFCPNQKNASQNLQSLLKAIRQIYADIWHPDAIVFRKKRGLLDSFEQMAIIIQSIVGTNYRDFFFPFASGVALSSNPFRWSQRIKQEDGVIRLVWGLGTRAVKPIADDYTRLIALSHPDLRPEDDARQIWRHSQKFVDAINLEANALQTLPVTELLNPDYPESMFVIDRLREEGDPASWDSQDADMPFRQSITFDPLLNRTHFVEVMRLLLQELERDPITKIKTPINIEFAVSIHSDASAQNLKIHLLQRRPFSPLAQPSNLDIPDNLASEDKIFSSTTMIPHGMVSDIRYIIYIDPENYSLIADVDTRATVAYIISYLNRELRHRFVLMGPGRWGSTNMKLGVGIAFSDIHNTSVLIELGHAEDVSLSTFSYGTHFFLDLIETGIFPLTVLVDSIDTLFRNEFFDNAQNLLGDILPQVAHLGEIIKLIDVPEVTNGKYLQIVMHSIKNEALAYLA